MARQSAPAFRLGLASTSDTPHPLLAPLPFAALTGWGDDDHAAAFAAFQASARRIAAAPPHTAALGIAGPDLQLVAREACATGDLSSEAARAFFERWFRPHRISAAGLVTAYFEPELPARRERDARFAVPLYRRPPDLVEVPPDGAPPGCDTQLQFGRSGAEGLTPYYTRAEIEGGALSGQGLELAWLESAVDAFFVHIQGSARLTLAGGEVMRVGYDGKSGHPYTSIGRVAVGRGLLSRDAADKDGLEAWMRAHPAAGLALMRENRSFVFFREITTLSASDGPLGAANVSLTAGRSIAIDQKFMTFHAPIWVDVPGLADLRGQPFRRVMIAQDTGSAIVGEARGDLFLGSGPEAGSRAGKVRHVADMTVLAPRPADEA